MKAASTFVMFLYLGLIGCTEPIRLETLNFDSGALNNYNFAIIDTVDNEYYNLLSQYVNLDSIISGETNPTEIAIKLTDYTHQQWQHNGSNIPSRFRGLTILKEAAVGEKFRCVEYSIVLTELLNASNIPTRQLGLKTKDVETRKSGAGHVAVEYYDKNYKKWIYADAQANIIAFKNDIPLNAVELQAALKQDYKIEVKTQGNRYLKEYKNWIGQYLYYFETSFDQRINPKSRLSYNGKTKLMLIPLGSKGPQIFQINNKIDNVIYTNSIAEFYPEIKG